MVALPLLFSSTVAVYAVHYEPVIQRFTWLHWLAVYTAASFTMAFALTPTTFIALASGYFLGWISLPLVVAAYLMASWMGYGAAWLVDHDNLWRTVLSRPGARTFVERLKSGELGVVILARLSPVLPFALMNAVLSMLRIRIRTFLWGGLVGMLPRTALAVWAGTQVREIRQLLATGGAGSVQQIGFIIVLVLSLAGMYWYAKKVIVR